MRNTLSYRGKVQQRRQQNVLHKAAFEPLEERRLMSLLGVMPGYPQVDAVNQNNTSVNYTYSSGVGSFDLSATTLTFQSASGGQQVAILSSTLGNPSFQIHFKTDGSGNVTGGIVGADFEVTGTVDLNNNHKVDAGEPTGILLEGEIQKFGYSNDGTTDDYDFIFAPASGALVTAYPTQYAGMAVGVTMTSENSTFNGSFTTNFTGRVKATAGPVPMPQNSPPVPDVSTTIFDSVGSSPTDVLGESVYDTTTVTGSVGGPTPTGTVTYNFYDTISPTYGVTTVVSSQTVTLNADGSVPTSSLIGPLAAGGYSFIATYSGDPNYSGNVGDPEPLTINQGTSSVNTTIYDSSGGPVTDSVGEMVYDSSSVTGSPFTPTGTVTYNFYNTSTPAYGVTSPVSTQTVTLNPDGTVPISATSSLLTPGSYSYIGVYSGDSNYSGSVGAVEPLTINQANPSIITTPGGATVVGSGNLTDSATLSSGYNPGGTITFYLFAPGVTPLADDSNNIYSDTVTVTGNGGYNTGMGNRPGGYPATNVGTYEWIAVYSGDSNNVAASDSFGSEPYTVSPTTPAINTSQQPAVATVGDSVADVATVTGGFNPSGTVTFNLYNNPNGTGTSLFTDTEALVGGMATSASYTTTGTGTDYWVATYNGDSNNNTVTSGVADEPVIVNVTIPQINTTQQPASTIVGSSIADVATVSGGYFPTGTVTFYLYNNASGTGTPLFTDTEALSGGMATSASYTTTSSTTDYWVATYNGDSNNNPITSGVADEPVVISPSTPSINTSQQPATAIVGSLIADNATVSGGYNPSGTVTFHLYNNPNGTGTPLFNDTEALVGGMATSANYTATATGSDYWVATYNGDGNNQSVTSGTADEPVVISPATPAVDTAQQPATAIVGASIADKATVSGGYNPTGTVTFVLYNNPSGTGTPLFTDTESLSGGMATSAGYTATATGTDYWVATYNGDSNNNSVTSPVTSEPVSITPSTPAINTSQQPASATVGTIVADKATVSGGFNPTGTVTFVLYNNPNGTGTPLFTDTESLSGGMATSAGYTAMTTGTDYWVATYNGDSNNNGVTSGTGDEPVVLTPASPAINTTQLPASATVGSSVADKATVTGGFNPTGTVTFKLYSSATTQNSSTLLFTDTETLNSSDVATSAGYTATATGTDYWVATYNGNSNNNSVAGSPTSEPVTITPGTPTINTTQQPATAVVGSLVADKAAVTGFNPTGTVTFKLYNNSTGSGTPLFTDTESLSGGSATSKGYTAVATGTDYWVAVYSGDTNNSSVTSPSTSEPVCITVATPSIITYQQPASAVVGASVADKATVSGGYNPSGTVTFKLYNNNTGSGTALFTDTETLSGGSATSKGYTTTAIGTDYWVATYNGDTNNGPVTSSAASEPVTISKATPTITTTASLKAGCTYFVSSAIPEDKAVVTGGVNPTGKLVFTLVDSNGNSTGITQTITVNGDATYTTTNTTAITTAGTYTWVVTYNGDTLNNSAHDQGGSAEQITVVGGSISGTKYQDQTGNGFSNDDYNYPLSGVTIDLLNSSGKVIATQKTGSDGSYDFTGLAAGTYTVEEVVPTGYVQTGPALGGTYTITLNSSTTTSTGNNFDDFQADCDLTDFSCVSFCIQDASGVKTVTDLRGNTNQGDEVTVFFNFSGDSDHPVTLVTYTAPDNYWNPNDAGEQQIFDVETIIAKPGENSITVQIPNCDYQIDFVCGYAIDQLGPNGSNITYSSQGRLISADNDGSEAQTNCFGQINGTVYLDLDNDGHQDSNETGIGGVVVQLTGKDSHGYAVSLLRITDGNGDYSFEGLQAGTYSIKEITPSGLIDGKDTLGTGAGGTVGSDLFSNLKVVCGTDGENYNFGEQPGAKCTGVATSGCAASCTFWNGTSGQKLICSFGGGSSNCSLGNWLASCYPNLYGSSCGTNCLSGKTNQQVCTYFQSLYKNSSCKTQCEVLAGCLNIYCTDSSLGGACGAFYGFKVQEHGAACDTYSVGTNGSCFGVSNNSKCTLANLISACNAGSSKGSLFSGNSSKGTSCYTVLSGINGW